MAAANVPPLNELAIFVSSLPFLEAKILIINIPIMEQNNPSDASTNGRDINVSLIPKSIISVCNMVDAIAIVAIIAPQYDSNISDPIPATSPTLSPTLSAITPGFLGSSSGISFSTLPTKSAPTSADLVKIPPPTLENKATVDAPIPKPCIVDAVAGSPPYNM